MGLSGVKISRRVRQDRKEKKVVTDDTFKSITINSLCYCPLFTLPLRALRALREILKEEALR